MPTPDEQLTVSPINPARDHAPVPEQVRRIGIIDLGSNTARLVVFECGDASSYRMIDSVRERIRLAEGLNRDGTLNPEAIGRALAAIELFQDYRDAVGLDDLELIATSAVRDATNRDEILHPLREMGFEPRVLEGASEAAYGVRAIANTMTFRDAWVIDQGGGSLQLSLMRDRGFVAGEAHPLGTLRLTEGFLADDPAGHVSVAEVQALEEHLENHLGEQLDELARTDAPLVAMGGTVRNLANVVQRHTDYPLQILHGYRLRAQAIEQLERRILRMSTTERESVRGLSSDRADVIAAGAIAFRWILERAQRDELVISGVGVREGALMRQLLPEPHLVDDVRRFSVGNLFRHYPQPLIHTENVRSLALQLFDSLEPIHELGPLDRQLLEAASILHDIGMTVSYYRHHHHGSFLLEAAGLEGFEHREIALLSLLLRYHRKGIPRADRYASLLTGDDDELRLWILATCLRMAEHLDRSRTGRIDGLSFELSEDRAVLELRSRSTPTVEMWEVAKDAELFELAFQRSLEVRHEPDSVST